MHRNQWLQNFRTKRTSPNPARCQPQVRVLGQRQNHGPQSVLGTTLPRRAPSRSARSKGDDASIKQQLYTPPGSMLRAVVRQKSASVALGVVGWLLRYVGMSQNLEPQHHVARPSGRSKVSWF